MTGIMDNPLTNGKEDGLDKRLSALREIAIETNKEWATKLGINPSVAITCVKPSGTVSQLVDSASGIHARHNPYYIRTIRADKKDPLCKMMTDADFPVEDDITRPLHTSVFSFPVKSPENAVNRMDMSAIEQLELWLTYQKHYCEHKPSVTISVRESEWIEVGAWVYANWEWMSGVSFLPFSDHTYRQAPYQDINKKQYEELEKKMPKGVDWMTLLARYESTDMTEGAQELACSAGGCEIV
jgi:ribonucleoside-diphosphate reductase alpha chain